MGQFVTDLKALASDDKFIQDTKDVVINDFFKQSVNDLFTIVPGIKGGQQVAALKGIEYVTKASAGCGGVGISPLFPAFSQKWAPKMAEVKIQICYADFENSFLQWGLQNGYARKDLTQTEMAIFIQDRIMSGMKEDFLRMVLLSDSNIDSQDILSDEATKLPFYNIIDKGLIPTLQYLKTLPEFADNFIPLDKNTGVIATQMNLGAEYALDLYESLILETYDFEGDTLLSSNRLAKNYDAYLKRGNGFGVQSNLDATKNGVEAAKVSGQLVTPIVRYDYWKKQDFTTNGSIHLPHFALFTKKEFLQVGVDDASALENLTIEYIGGADESLWIKGNYMFDFKMTNPFALKAAI